jgi:predicted AAA+ superfamily ATPase
MIKRSITTLLRQRLGQYPAAALIGPRQSGKTTLARALGGIYFDLEQEPDRLKLDLQWESLAGGDSLVILDEAQVWPEVFPRLRGTIDADRKRPGRFLLLGSVSPALMTQVSESLAGRLGLVELTPFLAEEIPRTSLSRLWLNGGFPDGGIRNDDRYPHWQTDYLSLLTQRDLPAWGLPAKPQVTERLLRMVAAVNGQIWNASQIGQSLGLSYATVNSYMAYLEGAFLIRQLQPYHGNLKKRLVRRPRCYWRDTGLLHALLQANDEDELLNQPWVGSSWEGFVIEQILGALSLFGRKVNPCFFRTSDGHEIDLVLDHRGERWAIEIKLTSSPSPGDFRRLEKSASLIKAGKRVLVSQTRTPVVEGDRISCSLRYLIELMGS